MPSRRPGADAPVGVADRAGFAAQLAGLKESTGLSFRELARRTRGPRTPLGLPFTTLRDYVQGRSLPPPERLDGILDAFGVPAQGRDEWRAALRRAAAAPARPPADLRPYPGPEPVGDGLRGRDALVAHVLQRVRAGGVVPVVGPSGVGVTSLLRAAVLPALPGPVEVLEPGPDPAAALHHTPFLLVDDLDTLAPEGPAREWLDDAVRALLAARVTDRVVLLGLREHRYAELAGVDGPLPVRVGGMSAADLREVIEGPAREAGFPPADGLADVVLGELDIAPDAPASPPGALPLLALALAATWEKTLDDGGSGLTLAHYRDSGGLHGAVAEAAEAAWAVLSAERRELARIVLLRMVRSQGTTGDVTTVRRRVLRAGYGYGLRRAQREDLDAVVDALVAARILTERERTVEIAHDAVVTGWPRLAGWIAEDREQRPARALLTEATRMWFDADRDDGALLRGRRLDVVTAFAAEPAALAELFPLERELLAISQARRADTRTDRRRDIRRLQATVVVLAVLLLAVVTALVVVVVGGGR
ncbi:hypothetical protein GCM10009836_21620 [Pseudonocardia ailaonensis]|uniref:Novel STAND NTPase 1 domain-containing protein n=1 Tax=Pseudonocardia ailaonensis TaxID=367279 RepID=A0ABN2MWS1_9PSEU